MRIPITRTPAHWQCKKRDGRLAPFDADKIRAAVANCFTSINNAGLPVDKDGIDRLVDGVTFGALGAIAERSPSPTPSVEDIQQLVIQQLWIKGLFQAAEAYQNYREEHRKKRDFETAAVFGRRVAFKPFDYPEAAEFKRAIQKSFWIVDEFSFDSDKQNFSVDLLPSERSAISRTLLAISQVEVNVKRFWTKLGDRLPRPEFEQVGVVFGDSEVRHADSYSKILDELSLNDAFDGVTKVPAIKQRIEYLNKAMRSGSTGTDRGFAKALAVFALLVENVSLFSQFAVVKSFSRKKGVLQNVDNVVQATMVEEVLHATFGAWLVNLIKSERPEWFDAAFYDDLYKTCREAFDAENAILDWVFEEGSISTISRPGLTAFLQDRINSGVTMIGGDPIFKVDSSDLAETGWFTEELTVPIEVDFFHKRSTNYSTPKTAVTAAGMW